MLPVHRQDVRAAVQARRTDTGPSVDDLAQDFPAGPFGVAAHAAAEDAAEVGADDADDFASDAGSDDEADIADDEHADAEALAVLDRAVANAAPFAPIADDAERELECALAAPAATRSQLDGTCKAVAAAAQAEADAWEPEGDIAYSVSVDGVEKRVKLTHRAALGVLKVRRFLMHQLTLDGRTGKGLVDRPAHMRTPQLNPEFGADHMALAHDTGERVMRTLDAVVDGILPEIPCRFAHCSPAMRDTMQSNGMCMVKGCIKQAVKGGDERLHLCGLHVRRDIRIAGTDEVMRSCSGCHGSCPVASFREAAGSETTGGTCDVCTVKRWNKRAAKDAAKVGTDPDLQEVPDRPEPSDAEVTGGLDADLTFRQERWLCAQRLGEAGARPGLTLTNPYLVLGMYEEERMANARQCVRVGCTYDIAKGRDGATLCNTCGKVCYRHSGLKLCGGRAVAAQCVFGMGVEPYVAQAWFLLWCSGLSRAAFRALGEAGRPRCPL